ncbi:MAG: hypothetical protein R2867_07745 [Caldilineaceae bacterium]
MNSLNGTGKFGSCWSAHHGSSQEQVDQATVHKGYRQHQLDLLRPRFKRPKKNEIPEFDENTGMMKASGYELTALGRLAPAT